MEAKYLDKDEVEALSKFVTKVKKEYDIYKIILYGSKSCGDYNEYSDTDILIITNNKLNAKELDDIFEISSSVNVDYGLAISSLIVNLREWEEEENINLALKINIETDGVDIAA